jgi:hypothetical protein
VQPADSLPASADGISRYRRAKLLGRESFASKLQVGGYYMCSVTAVHDVETQENVVRLHEICVDADGACSVVVTPLSQEGVDTHDNRLFSPTEHTFTLSPHTLCYPVHVVPSCVALLPSACTIHVRAPMPHAFEYSCFGLVGDHTACKTYAMNSYLVN